jgi:hypothetical protein
MAPVAPKPSATEWDSIDTVPDGFVSSATAKLAASIQATTTKKLTDIRFLSIIAISLSFLRLNFYIFLQ